jgi:iron complex transport system permease protein
MSGRLLPLFAAGLLVVALAISLRVGAVDLPLAQLLGVSNSPGADGQTPGIGTAVLQLRLARAASCVVVGALLALSGSVLQRLLRNPLADPFVLGISSGGTAFVVAATVIGLPAASLSGFPVRSVYAFAGCFLALGILLATRSRLERASDAGLALMGLVLNAFFGAALMLFVAFASAQELAEAQRWMLGSLQLVTFAEIAVIVGFASVPVAFLLRSRASIDALLFGDAFAQTLGFPSHLVRRRTLVATAVLVALVVSVAGSVGFVGLIVPHLSRALARARPPSEWWLSMTLGAALLLVADALARSVASPAELPVGVFTACLGAPVLGFILLKRISRE